MMEVGPGSTGQRLARWHCWRGLGAAWYSPPQCSRHDHQVGLRLLAAATRLARELQHPGGWSNHRTQAGDSGGKGRAVGDSPGDLCADSSRPRFRLRSAWPPFRPAPPRLRPARDCSPARPRRIRQRGARRLTPALRADRIRRGFAARSSAAIRDWQTPSQPRPARDALG